MPVIRFSRVGVREADDGIDFFSPPVINENHMATVILRQVAQSACWVADRFRVD